MKFKTSLIFLLILALLLAGCGAQKQQPPQTAEQPAGNAEPQKPETVEEATPAPVEEPPAAQYPETLPYVYHVPEREIYVNIPADPYFSSEWGYSKLFANGTERGIAVTALRSEDGSGKSAKDVYPQLVEKYLHNMRDYMTAKEIIVDQEQTLTVNGLEVYRFEGRVQGEFMSGIVDLYTVGYAFVIENTPCSIQGTVFYQEQDPESINEIRALVDEMITTVRTAE